MCLAGPAKVIEIKDRMATVEVRGVQRPASIRMLPEAKVGDYVLVHAGFAMQFVTEQDVIETNALWAEMNGAERTMTELPENERASSRIVP